MNRRVINRDGRTVILMAAILAAAGLAALVVRQGIISQAMMNSIGLVLFSAAVGMITLKFWRRQDAAIKQKETTLALVREEKAEVERKARALAEEHEELKERVIVMEKQLAVVNQAVIPLNAAMQAALIKQLTHYHTPELDALLVKLEEGTLTKDEEARMWVMVKQREVDMGDQIPEEEREAAHILPIIVKRARAEAAAVEEPAEILLVAVPKAPDPAAEPESEVKNGGQT